MTRWATWGRPCEHHAAVHTSRRRWRRHPLAVREAGEDRGIAEPRLTCEDPEFSTVHRPYYDYP